MEKTLNVQKLLESGFINRFKDFTQRYEEAFKKNKITEVAEDWIKKEDYDYIGHFLRTTHFERVLPFSAEEFIKMEYIKFRNMQYVVSERCKIADEKESLYKEFQTFYE